MRSYSRMRLMPAHAAVYYKPRKGSYRRRTWGPITAKPRRGRRLVLAAARG
jgi:hypothetical protein